MRAHLAKSAHECGDYVAAGLVGVRTQTVTAVLRAGCYAAGRYSPPRSRKADAGRRIPAARWVPDAERERGLLVAVGNPQRRAGLRLRCALALAVFPFAAWSRDLCAGALRLVAGFADLFASIHLDIAAEQAMASSGTVMSLSRAIALA